MREKLLAALAHLSLSSEEIFGRRLVGYSGFGATLLSG